MSGLSVALLIWMASATVIAIDTHRRVGRLEKRLVDVERVAEYVKFKQKDRPERRKEWI